MVKSDLIKTIQTQVGVSPFTAKAVVDEVINQITTALANGDEVTLRGLGVFKTKRKSQRMGRNPKTGETVKVPATKVPKFSAAKALKDAVK